ncbi:acyl-CoA dehydrogenase family protein [Streptomyces sp. NPDC086182]|uniref:acyl-CoA dehydrogenase family protein n=1 Tax=Streptomyces sp. NPDC086182 TaxID=3155058 RepID=UPI00342B6911
MTAVEGPALKVPAPDRAPSGSRSGAGADLAARAAQAADAAARHAARADRDRALHPEVERAACEAGFARHFVPGRWGGAQGTFSELLGAVAVLGEACASAAWCAALWAAHGRFAAYLPPAGQRELWATSPDVRIAAGVMPPAGSAEPTGDGWRLQGEWECVSGAESADWLLLAARDTSGAECPARVFLVPREQVAVRDVWHSTGLRGTGSNTVVVAPVTVPGHRTFALTGLLHGTPGPGRARCHSVPAHMGAGLLFAAPALGSARQALKVWSAWACPPAGAAAPARAQASVRETLARSSAEIDAAALLLEQAAWRADTAAVSAAAVTRNRRDAAFAADLLVSAVERLFRTGGRHARDDGGCLQRCWRDVHTAAAHGVLRMETAADAYASAVCA